MEAIETLSENRQYQMQRVGMFSYPFSLPAERLREVFVDYYDPSETVQRGSLIVLDIVAVQVQKIFKELLSENFIIETIKPICDYDAEDTLSMQDNNSSAYNPRQVLSRKDEISSHSYGMALDINPLYNPYITFSDTSEQDVRVYPIQGKYFMNRHIYHPMMVERIVPILKENGFTIWGGEWKDRRIDYHHFQVPNSIAILCSHGSYEIASDLWYSFLADPKQFHYLESVEDRTVYNYMRSNPTDGQVKQRFHL